MSYVIGLVWNFIEVAYVITLGMAFLQSRLSKKKSIAVYLISSVLLCIALNILNSQVIQQFFVYAYLCVLSCILYRGSIFKHLLIAIVGYIFSGIFDSIFLYGMCSVLGISLSDFVWRKLAYTATVTVSKLLALFLAWLILKIRKQRRAQKIHPRWLLLTLIFPIVSLLMLTVVFISHQSSSDLSASAFAFSIGLAVANIAILYLIHRMEHQTQKEHEMLLLNQQMEIQTDSIVALEKSYRAQRQATHEFRHHLQTINDLLGNSGAAAAQDYLSQLLQTQTSRVLCVNSGHPIIDAVVNQKYQAAKERDIDMQIQVNDLSGISVETEALVVLLSNLLDNAVEACQKVEQERTIECSILAGDGLLISIRNTSVPVTIIGNSIPTTKEPKEEHGYGLLNTLRILEKLNAEYTFHYDNGWFRFVAEIPR